MGCAATTPPNWRWQNPRRTDCIVVRCERLPCFALQAVEPVAVACCVRPHSVCRDSGRRWCHDGGWRSSVRRVDRSQPSVGVSLRRGRHGGDARDSQAVCHRLRHPAPRVREASCARATYSCVRGRGACSVDLRPHLVEEKVFPRAAFVRRHEALPHRLTGVRHLLASRICVTNKST